jgi:carboxymethylenebutenolidase
MSEIQLPCFLARPTGPVRGGIVVGHEGIGLNNHVLRFAEALAAEGYVAVAPDFFFRTGGPKEYEDFWVPINAVTHDQLRTDLAGAIELLRTHGATSIGVTGFCMGGNTSYRAALWADELGVDAAFGFYGSLVVDELGQPRCPITLVFGGDDEYCPTADVEKVRAHHPGDVVVYPDAGHSFMRDDTASHHPEAAADAWARLLAFFGQHLSQS